MHVVQTLALAERVHAPGFVRFLETGFQRWQAVRISVVYVCDMWHAVCAPSLHPTLTLPHHLHAMLLFQLGFDKVDMFFAGDGTRDDGECCDQRIA